jgi:hypothetical protein
MGPSICSELAIKTTEVVPGYTDSRPLESCRRLSPAFTPVCCVSNKQGVDGRVKPGHDSVVSAPTTNRAFAEVGDHDFDLGGTGVSETELSWTSW